MIRRARQQLPGAVVVQQLLQHDGADLRPADPSDPLRPCKSRWTEFRPDLDVTPSEVSFLSRFPASPCLTPLDATPAAA